MTHESGIPDFAERLSFWKFFHALDCFQQAKNQCDYILQEKSRIPKGLYRNILTAYFVVYGKPFKNRKATRLPEDVVPNEMRILHDEIVRYRDKLFAHSDLDGINEEMNEYLDHVEIHVSNGKAMWHGTSLFSNTERFAEYRHLCNALIEKMQYHYMRIAEKWHRRSLFPSEEGVYRLNVREQDNEVMYHKTENLRYG